MRLGVGWSASLLCVAVSGCAGAPGQLGYPTASFYEADESIEAAVGSDPSYAGVELSPDEQRVTVWRVAPAPDVDEAAAGIVEDVGGELRLVDAAYSREHLCGTRDEFYADDDLVDDLGLADFSIGVANDGSGLLLGTTTTADDLPTDIADDLERRLGVPVFIHPGVDPLRPLVFAEPGLQAGSSGCTSPPA